MEQKLCIVRKWCIVGFRRKERMNERVLCGTFYVSESVAASRRGEY